MKKSVILATVAAMVCSTSITFASETDPGNQTQGGNATNVVTEYKNSEVQSEQVAQKTQSEQVTQKPQEAVASGDQAKDRSPTHDPTWCKPEQPHPFKYFINGMRAVPFPESGRGQAGL